MDKGHEREVHVDARPFRPPGPSFGGPVQIDQFEGNLGLMWEKFALGPALGTTVDGHDALWFDDPVALVYVDASGLRHTESTRLTDGTLVWMDEGLTFRLDGVRPLDAALVVARSMKSWNLARAGGVLFSNHTRRLGCAGGRSCLWRRLDSW